MALSKITTESLLDGEITAAKLSFTPGITLGTAVASTSGATIDFTGIPSGTKRISISFVGVSTSGATGCIVQLGDSGGIETSGYLGAGFLSLASHQNITDNPTVGMPVETDSGAASVRHGGMILTLVDASTFTWQSIAIAGRSDTVQLGIGGASKSLSAELTQVRITTRGGSETFDAGKVNISYE